MWWAIRNYWSMKRLSCCRNSIKSSETPNVFALRRQAANSIECRRETGWRFFFFAARKNRYAVRSRSAEPCKIIRTFRYGWEFTVAQSTELPMETIKRTLQDRE